jgi:hypothetical protein
MKKTILTLALTAGVLLFALPSGARAEDTAKASHKQQCHKHHRHHRHHHHHA